ncbi:reductase [Lipomyces starkeyi]
MAIYEGPYPTEFHAYSASKIAALKVSEDFMAKNKPDFDLVNICPSMVIGRDELVTDPRQITSGTNAAVMGMVLGNKTEYPYVGASVHLEDIAFMYVKALDQKVPAGTYIGNSEGATGTVWQDATSIVASAYPKALKKCTVPNDGVHSTRTMQLQVSKSEKVFGLKFRSYEEQVRSVVSHYFELNCLACFLQYSGFV